MARISCRAHEVFTAQSDPRRLVTGTDIRTHMLPLISQALRFQPRLVPKRLRNRAPQRSGIRRNGTSEILINSSHLYPDSKPSFQSLKYHGARARRSAAIPAPTFIDNVLTRGRDADSCRNKLDRAEGNCVQSLQHRSKVQSPEGIRATRWKRAGPANSICRQRVGEVPRTAQHRGVREEDQR